MKKRAVGLAILVVGIALQQPLSAEILWGLDTDPDALITIDTTTGGVTTIGPLPTYNFGGLDFDSSGTLYAMLLTPSFASDLYTLNTSTAAATLVGSAPLVFESFEIVSGRAYAAQVVPSEALYEVNLADGSAALVGSHDTDGGDNRVTGLAANGPDLVGTRYYDEDLVALNQLTGGVDSVIGNHGLLGTTNLAFADGMFWTVVGTSLYSLDPLTADPTLVWSGLDVGEVTGLTNNFAQPPPPPPPPPPGIPEPGAGLLTAMGLLALVVTGRKRRSR